MRAPGVRQELDLDNQPLSSSAAFATPCWFILGAATRPPRSHNWRSIAVVRREGWRCGTSSVWLMAITVFGPLSLPCGRPEVSLSAIGAANLQIEQPAPDLSRHAAPPDCE